MQHLGSICAEQGSSIDVAPPLCSPTPADISTELQTSVHNNSKYRVQRAAIIIPAVLAAMMAILLCIKCCQANVAHSETPPAVETSLASQRKSVVPMEGGTACDIPVIVIAPGEQVIWSWCSTRICRLSSAICELSYNMGMAACLELACEMAVTHKICLTSRKHAHSGCL